MTFTEIAISRPTLVVVIFTVLALLGILSYSMLNYELLPKIDIPVISVSTVYFGASADEVESSVTEKIEDALSSLENMKYMSSTSQESMSIIIIELEPNTDIDRALQDAQRKVDLIQFQLPDAADNPSLMSFSSQDIPILRFGITAKINSKELYQLVKDQIKPQLAKIDGVGQVTLIGGDEREIKINVDRNKLENYKLSIAQVFSLVNNSNMQFATGKVESVKNEYTLRLTGKVTSLNQLRELIISADSTERIVMLKDVAEIVDGVAEYSTLNRINGEPAIGIQVQKQSDANSVKVAALVKKELARLERQYSANDLEFKIASDNSLFTLAAAHSVMEDLLFAIILVAFVMFFFLHSIRNSFIVMISIPTSIVSVFVGMYIFDFSLNLMTLMGLSLVIGILVDDSIVVLENIQRHLAIGEDKRAAALHGRNEIGFTAVAITLVDVVVFVPLALITGLIGNIMREFALVIVFSTLMSLFVSFTITPLLASRIGKLIVPSPDKFTGKISLAFERWYNRLVASYERTLVWSLAHRMVVFISITIIFISSIFLIVGGFVGNEFMANPDRAEFVVQLEGDPQNTLYQTNLLTQKVETLLLKKPEVEKVFANIGYSNVFSSATSSEQYKSEIDVIIINKRKRDITVEEYAANVKKEILSAVPAFKVTSVPSSVMGQIEAPIQILLRGPKMEDLYKIADTIMTIIAPVQGVNDIRLSVERSKPELHLELDRDRMSILGLTVADIGSTLQIAFAGNTDLLYTEGGTDYDINVKLDQFDRRNLADVASITFLNKFGDIVKLGQFAKVTQEIGPNKLERYERISSLMVKAEVYGRPIGTVGNEIKELVAKKIKSPDVMIDYKGQLEMQADAFKSLLFAFIAAILLVYFVMVALYNSYLYPFVVLFSLPVAIIGALLALALAAENLTIFSLLGMIMLMGLVAKNAILLVDFTNRRRQEGLSVLEGLVEAGKERLRPILMTTIAMVFGMLPLALSQGDASENRHGLAWVIIGGLTSSLILTLVLVPSVYMTAENIRTRLSKKFRRKKNNP